MLAVFSVETQRFMGVGATYIPAQHYFEDLFGPISMAHWLVIYGVMRKLGHMTGYGIFSALFFRALYLQRHRAGQSLWKLHGFALLATALVGSLDELHQSYTPGRDGTPVDVAFDTTGALIAQFILFLIFRIHSLSSKQKI